MNVSSSTSPIARAYLNEGESLSGNISHEPPLLFLGFSLFDQKLMQLIKTGVCTNNGRVAKQFSEIVFPNIPVEHNMHQAICEMIHSVQISDPLTQNDFIVSQIVRYLYDYSRTPHSEEIEGRDNILRLLQPITDAQIMGSTLWKLLADHPEILIEIMYRIFATVIPQEILNEWINELLIDINESQRPSERHDIDYRIICPGKLRYRACLSEAVRQLSQDHFPESAQPRLNKFSIINSHTTLIGFEFEHSPVEFIFTDKEQSLSSGNSLYVSFLNTLLDPSETLEISCGSFSAAQVLADRMCKIYSPTDFDNPQGWVRLVYNSDCIPLGEDEKKMVEHLLRSFKDISTEEELRRVLRQLDHKPDRIENMFLKTGRLIGSQEDAIVRYLYILISAKIHSKQIVPENSDMTANTNIGFLWRSCQSLQTHSHFSDQAISTLWKFLDAEGMLFHPGMNRLFACFHEAIINTQVPFSVISSIMVMISWLYAPQTFTMRQTPPIFFIEPPLVMRTPANLKDAHIILKNYLTGKDCDLNIIKKILGFFLNEDQIDNRYYLKICSELALCPLELRVQADFLFNHSDPTISLLGLKLKLLHPEQKIYLEALEKLPEFINKKLHKHLIYLFNNFTNHFKLYEETTRALHLPDWIKLVIRTNDCNFIILSYKLLLQCDNLNNEALPHVLDALSRNNSNLAVNLLKKISDNFELEPLFALRILQNILFCFKRNHASGNFELLFPVAEKAMRKIIGEQDDKRIGIFSDSLLYFLNHLESKEKKRFLLLIAIIQNFLRLNEIPNHLTCLLSPLLPFLYNLKNEQIILSEEKKAAIFALFQPDPDNHLVPWDEKNSWIKIVSAMNYPEKSLLNESMHAGDFLEVLKEINLYQESDTALDHIFLLLQRSSPIQCPLDFCNMLRIDEPSLTQASNLLIEHPHPLIKSIGLQICLGIPNCKIPGSYLRQLPQILGASQTSRNGLRMLFQKIVDKYSVNSEKLNLDVLTDWLKLFAQTKEPELIDIALSIRQEEQEETEGSDLMIFAGLTYVDPHAALKYFCNLYQKRSNRLDPVQVLNGLKRIKQAYRANRVKYLEDMGLLHPILKGILDFDSPFDDRSRTQDFVNILIDYLEHQEINDSTNHLLLSALLKGLISLSLLNEKFVDHILSIQSANLDIDPDDYKNFQRIRIEMGEHLLEANDARYYILLDRLQIEEMSSRLALSFYEFTYKSLNRLLDTRPFDEQNPERLNKLIEKKFSKDSKPIAALISRFLDTLNNTDVQNFSPAYLEKLDQALINFTLNDYSMEGLGNKITAYLNYFPISTSRLNNVSKILTTLIKQKNDLDNSFYLLILKLIEQDFNENCTDSNLLHPCILFREEHFISFVDRSSSLVQANRLIQYYKKYRLETAPLISINMKICNSLATDTSDSYMSLIEQLEMQSEKKWENYFAGLSAKLLEDSLIIILNFLITKSPAKEMEKGLRWICFIINHYFSRFSKAPLIEASEEKLIKLIPFLLSYHLLPGVRKYLLLSENFPEKISSDLIQIELNKEYLLKNVNFSYCFELIKKYFPNDPEQRFIFLKLFNITKEPALIDLVIDDLRNIQTQSFDRLADCWLIFFTLLKNAHHDKIWSFFDNFPFLNSTDENQKKIKETFDLIILEGAALNLLNKIQTSKQFRRNKQQHSIKLFEKLNKIEKIPYGIFFLVFSALDQNLFLTHPEQCFERLIREFNKNPSIDLSVIPKKYLSHYSANLNFLFSRIVEIPDNKYLFELSLCLRFHHEQLNIRSNDLLKRLLLLHFDLIVPQGQSNCPLVDISFYESYFSLYAMAFKSTLIEQEHITHAVHLFKNLTINYEDALVQNGPPDQNSSNRKQALLLVVLQANRAIFPKEIPTNSPYTTLLFDFIVTSKNFELKRRVLSGFARILKGAGKNTNPFIQQIKSNFLQLIDSEIHTFYSCSYDEKQRDTHLKLIIELIAFAQEYSMHKNLQELYYHLQLMNPKHHNKELCRLSKPEICQQNFRVIQNLLDFKNRLSSEKISYFLINFIVFDTFIPEDERLNLYTGIWKTGLLFPEILTEQSLPMTLFKYCQEHNVLIKNFNVLKQENNTEYLNKLLYFSIDLISNYIEELEFSDEVSDPSNTFKFEMMAHLTNHALMMITKMIELNCFKHSYTNFVYLMEFYSSYILEIQTSELTEVNLDVCLKSIHEFTVLILNDFYNDEVNVSFPAINLKSLTSWMNNLYDLTIFKPELKTKICNMLLLCMLKITRHDSPLKKLDLSPLLDLTCVRLKRFELTEAQLKFLKIIEFKQPTDKLQAIEL